MENLTSRQPLEMTLDQMEFSQSATAVIVRSNRDGSDGTDGKDGNGSQNDECTKTVDVGFIDRGDKNFKPVYFGFDKDEQLIVNYYDEMPSEPFVLCKIPGIDAVKFAKIEVVQDDQRIKMGAFLSQKKIHSEAVKKKAITRSSLEQHVAQITERKEMSDAIKNAHLDTMETNSQQITDIDYELKAVLLLKRISHCHPIVEDVIKTEQGDRPAEDVYDYLNNCGSSYCACNLCQTKMETTNVRLNPQLCIGYIDRFSTTKEFTKNPPKVGRLKVAPSYRTKQFVLRVKDDDKEFPLSSAKKSEFLQFETDRLWKKIWHIRNGVKKEIVKPENQKLVNLIERHNPSGASLDDKVDYMLSRCLGLAAGMWNETLISKCGNQMQNLMNFFIAELKKRFVWEEFDTLSDDWKCEYRKSFQLMKTFSWIDILEKMGQDDCHFFYVNNFFPNEEGPSIQFSHTVRGFRREQRLLLCEEDGTWHQLEMKGKLKKFLGDRTRQAAIFRQNYKTQYAMADTTTTAWHFPEFVNWFQKNCLRSSNGPMATLIVMLDPQHGDTPVELFKLLWWCLTLSHGKQLMGECCSKDVDRLTSYVSELAERVLDYNSRNIDPIFYLHTVANFCPHRWKYEFLLLEVEERMLTVLQPEERDRWREALSKLSDRTVSMLRGKLTEIDGEKKKQFENILKMLAEDLEFTENDMTRLSRLPLSNWIFDLQIKLFEKKLTAAHENLDRDAMNEGVYTLLMELENQTDKSQRNSKLYGRQEAAAIGQKRKFDEIINVMQGDSTNTISLPYDVRQAIKSSFNFPNRLAALRKDGSSWSGKFDSINDITSWAKQSNFNLRKRQSKRKASKNIKLHPSDFLYVYDRAVELVFPRKTDGQPFRLLDTQRVAIMALLTSKSPVLAQISTGEGKSLIVAGLAIYHAINGHKVDVITSNNLLAIRDSTESASKGGLCDLYAVFDVSVDNNCSQLVDDRVKAYDSPVVYGELANFQRDFLLHEFYDRNIRGDRDIPGCYVIVDEVDCMLLDRGNNMLYLSHDIPGMEMLESLYVFIWEKICISTSSLDEIKSAVLYDLYGAINKNELTSVHSALENRPVELNAIWTRLIENDVIDYRGRLLITDVEKIPEMATTIDIAELRAKLVFFFRRIASRERRIKIPKHLLSFVDRHLETWLGNAWRALNELKLDTDYVVSQDWTGTSLDVNPQVIIIDPDTGTDQISSQWDKALHQFLQLKEGCQITMQSLKAVFISNVNYITKYKKLYGVSGTLGSKKERDFLKETYECNYFTLPTAFPRIFDVKAAQVLKTEENWFNAITNETRRTVLSIAENLERPRSILIFCQSINKVNAVYLFIKNKLNSELSNGQVKIHRYTRNYQKFPYESDKLETGHVIVATNLAGRGTDIKISQKLRGNGGLHICLTYLPENERVEEQAMGRAGRQGDPGSGILILYQPDATEGGEWGRGKIFEMKLERNRIEAQRLSRLTQDFIGNINQQEIGFQLFSKHFNNLRRQMVSRRCDDHTMKAVCESALDQWALWLDSVDSEFGSLSEEKMLNRLENELINKQKLPDEMSELINWMTPARSVALARNIATRKITKRKISVVNNLSQLSINKAIELLDRIIQSEDHYFYPAAYYYRAFTFIKTDGNRTEFTKMLRMVDTILEQQIQMQTLFYQIISQTLQVTSAVNSSPWYKIQKENNIKLLEHFLDSVRSLLGSHNFSTWDLQMEAGVEAERVDEYFHKLVSSGCVVCEINDVDTVPNYEDSIEKIADHYGVDQQSLVGYLQNLEKNLSEKELEEKISKTEMIRCTREHFWRTLVKAEALQRLPQTIRPNGDETDDGTDCVILSKCDLERKPLNKLNRRNNIDIDYMSSNSEFRPILFSPTFDDGKDLDNQNKIVFAKSYVREILSADEFRRTENIFQFNKIACLNLNKLATVDPKTLGQLKIEDLRRLKINKFEWPKIWRALVDQNIIDSEGHLSVNYNDQEFSFPDCPLYERPVLHLIKKTLAAEIVRRKWMNARGDPELLKAIIKLPLEPYRDLLSDFHSVHVISGSRVADNFSLSEIKTTLRKIIDTSKEESDRIASLLKSRQSVYSANEKPAASLVRIEPAMSEGFENICTELFVFGLLGFDHIIEIREKKWQMKMIFRAAAILVIGVAHLLVAGAIIFMKVVDIWSLKIPKLPESIAKLGSLAPAMSFIKEGIKDIAFAIEKLETGHYFSWGDYRRRKIMTMKESFEIGEDTWNFINRYILKKKGTEVGKCQLTEPVKLVKPSNSITGIKITKGMNVGLSYQQVESLVYSQLTALCSKLAKDLFDKTMECFEHHVVVLKRSYNPLPGAMENERVYAETIKRIVTEWVKEGDKYLSRVLLNHIGKQLNEALGKKQMIAGKSTENEESEMADVVIATTKRVLENEMIKTLVENLVDKLTTHQFSADRIDMKDVKHQLREAVEKLMSPWTLKLLENIARLITDMATRDINNQTLDGDGSKVIINWKELLQQTNRQKNTANDALTSSSRINNNEDHIKFCLKMMKETRDPKLFVAFIRENVSVPADPFCAHALSCALNATMEQHNSSKVFIRIESLDQVLFDNQTSDSRFVFVGKVNQVLENQRTSITYISTDDGNDIVCMFDWLAKEIALLQLPHMFKITGTKLRHLVVNIVEKNAEVSAAIRKGWHSHTLRIGLFGMMGERNYQRTKKKMPSTVEELGREKVYQHPGYACIEQFAKHKDVRNILRHEHPVIKILYHSKPQNNVNKYQRSSGNNDERSNVVCEEEGICVTETFYNMQKCYLERGDYKSAIWNSVETYLIPIIEWQEDILKREQFVKAALEHFESYAKLKRVGGRGKTVVSEDEFVEMKKRLIIFTPNIRISEEFWKKTVASIR